MPNDLRVIVTTCDKSAWTLRPFAYLFNEYYKTGEQVNVLSENVIPSDLPDNFKQYTIGDWPKEKWTDGLLKHLDSIKEQYVIIFLDDYWLHRTVDVNGIATLLDYMKARPNVLRVDLTLDRYFANGPQYPLNDPPQEFYGHYNIYNRANTQYQMSLQPGIWNKRKLMSLLKPNWTPWQVELDGTGLVNEDQEIQVVGTSQELVRFTNGLRVERESVDTSFIAKEHIDKINSWIGERKV